jgi:hypothetical protein
MQFACHRQWLALAHVHISLYMTGHAEETKRHLVCLFLKDASAKWAHTCAGSRLLYFFAVRIFCLTWMLQANVSCLAIAAARGHLHVVKYLCSLGYTELIALKTNRGNSPLALAKHCGHEEVAEYLASTGMQSWMPLQGMTCNLIHSVSVARICVELLP